MDLSSAPPRSSFMPQPPLGHADGGPRIPAAPPPAPRPPYPAALPSRPSSHATLGYPAPWMSCHPEGGALHGHHRQRALAGEPRSGPGPGPAPAGPHSAAPAGEPATPSPEPAPFPILKVEDGHGHGRRRWEQERREKGEV